MRPSSLPALKQCPRFISKPEGSDYATAGTERHATLAAAIQADWVLPEGLDEETRSGLQWAIDYIKANAPMSDHPIVSERRRDFTTPGFETISGTPDIVCGNVIFDLKWRWADYEAQMAAYACMLFESGWDRVEVHVLYAQPQSVKVYRWTAEEAMAIVCQVVDSVTPDAEPQACEFCDWCEKQLTCPAVTKHINRVIEGRPDFNLDTWHSSEISDPVEMGKALKIARIVSDWAESVEHHAKEMAVKQGKIPIGFKLQSRRGNRFISNLQEAFSRSTLPQEKFFEACEVKLSKLIKTYAAAYSLKQDPAERELEAKLADVIQRKPSTQSLFSE